MNFLVLNASEDVAKQKVVIAIVRLDIWFEIWSSGHSKILFDDVGWNMRGLYNDF